MKILSFDPGAKRLGWAVVSATPQGDLYYHGSGLLGLTKEEGIKDQEYKLLLIESLIEPVLDILEEYMPDQVSCEIVPSVGSGNFSVAGQSYMANTAIVVAKCLAYQVGIPVKQIAARTMQTTIAKRPDKPTKKITKVQVRNGVTEFFPSLKDRAKDMSFDETDAIAVGLASLGVHYPGLLDVRQTGKEA